MRLVLWIFVAIVVTVLAALLHYSLPSRDVVRIVGTDVKRMDVSSSEFIEEGDGSGPNVRTRDVRFINAIRPNNRTSVYRNEDTDWGFPPYLKFDSSDLQAEAQALISTAENPVWVVVTHYGWRIRILSLFPNAVSIRQADGPDETLIPWFNIAFFVVLIALAATIWRFIQILRRRHIDPVLDDISDAVDDVTESATYHANEAEERATGLYNRWQRWLDTWRPKDKRRFRR